MATKKPTRKRRAPATKDDRPLRRRTRLQFCSARVRLLDLPAEIRLTILKKLLWTPKVLMGEDHPIRDVHVGHVHPTILRVCRQLYQEGRPFLYENTVGAWCSPFSREEMLRYDYIHHLCIPKSVWAHISKIKIFVQFDIIEYEDDPYGLSSFSKALRDNPHWQHLTVSFDRWDQQYHEDEVPDLSDDELQTYEKEILSPLQYRSLKSVKFEGFTNKAYTEQLTMKMLSKPSLPDLDSMFEQTFTYLSATLVVDDYGTWGDPPGEDPVEYGLDEDARPVPTEVEDNLRTLLYKLGTYRNVCDIDQFRHTRERIMRLSQRLLLDRQRELMKYDPADWTAPFDLQPLSLKPTNATCLMPELTDTSRTAEYERRTFYADTTDEEL